MAIKGDMSGILFFIFASCEPLRNKVNTMNKYLRGDNCMLLAHRAIVYCYLKFKLSYLKNLKLFSIRVKQLSDPIVL